VLFTLTDRGYIKRVKADTYRAQRRGGRGIIGARTRDTDEVADVFHASTRDRLLFFTDRGRVYQLPAWHVPESSREATGTPLVNLVQLGAGERVTVVLAAPASMFEEGSHLVMVTRRGRIKRTALAEYDGVRRSGLIALVLEEGDELEWARITSGDDELILVSRRGMALRFNEKTVRPQGRVARGVMAMRLREGDSLAAMDLVRPGSDLFIVTRHGYGKRTPLSQYRTLGRYNQGVRTIDIHRLDELGEIADARVVDEGAELTLITDHGIVMRTPVSDISRMGRSTRGVRVMNLDAGQQVASLAYSERPSQELEEMDGEDGGGTVELAAAGGVSDGDLQSGPEPGASPGELDGDGPAPTTDGPTAPDTE